MVIQLLNIAPSFDYFHHAPFHLSNCFIATQIRESSGKKIILNSCFPYEDKRLEKYMYGYLYVYNWAT